MVTDILTLKLMEQHLYV